MPDTRVEQDDDPLPPPTPLAHPHEVDALRDVPEREEPESADSALSPDRPFEGDSGRKGAEAGVRSEPDALRDIPDHLATTRQPSEVNALREVRQAQTNPEPVEVRERSSALEAQSHPDQSEPTQDSGPPGIANEARSGRADLSEPVGTNIGRGRDMESPGEGWE